MKPYLGIKCVCPFCGHKSYSMGKFDYNCPKCTYQLSITVNFDRSKYPVTNGMVA